MTSGTSYLVKGLESETDYKFKVRAVDNEGEKSKFSAAVEITTLTGPKFTVTNVAGKSIEGEEDAKVIRVEIANKLFVEPEVTLENLTVKGLPAGTGIGQIRYLDKNNIEIVLSGNSTADYDKDLNIEIWLSSDMVSDAIDTSKTSVVLAAIIEERPASPVAVLERGSRIGIKLNGLDAGMEVKVGTTEEWTSVPEGITYADNGDFEIGTKIYVRKKATLRTEASLIQTLIVTEENSFNFNGEFETQTIYQNYTDGKTLTFKIEDDTFNELEIIPGNVVISETNALSSTVVIDNIRLVSEDTMEISLDKNISLEETEDIYLDFEFISKVFTDYPADYTVRFNLTKPAKAKTPQMRFSNGTDHGLMIIKDEVNDFKYEYRIRNAAGEFLTEWTLAANDISDNVQAAAGDTVLLRYAECEGFTASETIDHLVKKFEVEELQVAIYSDKEMKIHEEDGTKIIFNSINDEFVEAEVTAEHIYMMIDEVAVENVRYLNPHKIELTLKNNSVETESLDQAFIGFGKEMFKEFEGTASVSFAQATVVETLKTPVVELEKASNTEAKVVAGQSENDFYYRNISTDNIWKTVPENLIILAKTNDELEFGHQAGEQMKFDSETVKLTVDYLPSAPANLRATSTSFDSISLVWDASEDDLGVAEYKVYMNGEEIATTTATSYKVEKLESDISFVFRVVAYDTIMQNSGSSNELTVSTSTRPEITFSASVENNGDIEAAEDGKKIRVSVTNSDFIEAEINTTNITMTNAPAGLSIASVTFVDADNIDIVLSGISTEDYDADVTASINIATSAVFDLKTAKSADVVFVATVEATPEAPSSPLVCKGTNKGVMIYEIDETMELFFTEVYDDDLEESVWNPVPMNVIGYDDVIAPPGLTIYFRYKANGRIPASYESYIEVDNEIFNNFVFYPNPVQLVAGQADMVTLTFNISYDDHCVETNVTKENVSLDLEGFEVYSAEYIDSQKINITIAGTYSGTLTEDSIRLNVTIDKSILQVNNKGDKTTYVTLNKTTPHPGVSIYMYNGKYKMESMMYVPHTNLEYRILDAEGTVKQGWAVAGNPDSQYPAQVLNAVSGDTVEVRFYNTIDGTYSPSRTYDVG